MTSIFRDVTDKAVKILSGWEADSMQGYNTPLCSECFESREYIIPQYLTTEVNHDSQ